MGKPCKYRLIKEYPGSPKKGSIHFWSVKEATDGWLGQIIYDNNPEFWGKVEEKDYEILSFKHTCFGFIITPDIEYDGTNPDTNFIGAWNRFKIGATDIKIHSIKRLSDGEVFTVGDEIKTRFDGSFCVIYSFKIKDDKLIIDCTHSYLAAMRKMDLLPNIEKVKQPLFITEDGVEIFDGDTIWGISLYDYSTFSGVVRCGNNWHIETWRYGKFSTKEAAEKWIDENKPKYSKKQINHSINELFSPELSRDGSAFGDALKEGYRTAFFKYLENDKT